METNQEKQKWRLKIVCNKEPTLLLLQVCLEWNEHSNWLLDVWFTLYFTNTKENAVPGNWLWCTIICYAMLCSEVKKFQHKRGSCADHWAILKTDNWWTATTQLCILSPKLAKELSESFWSHNLPFSELDWQV